MSNKIKLTSVIIVCIFLILLGLTLTLSYISIDSIKSLGRHSIKVNEDSIKNNSKLFFLEITRRTAGAYSTYLSAVEDMLVITGSNLKEILTGKTLSTKQLVNKNKFKQYKKPGFYLLHGTHNFNSFYIGNNKGLDRAEGQINEITSIIPTLKALYNENPLYFKCVWLHTNKNIYLEYPKHYNISELEIEGVKKYFNHIHSEYPYEKSIKEHRPIWTKPYKDISSRVNLDVYQYIFSDEGDFLAAIGVDFNFEKFLETILNNSLFSDYHYSDDKDVKSAYNKMEGFIFIVQKDGSLVIFPSKHSKLISLPKVEFSKINFYPDLLDINLKDSLNHEVKQLAELIKNSDIGVDTIKLQGENYIIAYRSIPVTGWVLCFATLEKSLMTAVDETKRALAESEEELAQHFVIVSIIYLIIFLFIAFLFFRFFLLKPLYRIRNKMKIIGEGNFDIKLNEHGFAEISDMAVTFNNLTKELKEYTKNLEKEVKQRQSIETELDIASKLQNSVLPQITDEFKSDKFEINAKLVPATEMSGDFYDFFYVNKETLCIVLADVCGKGITAAFYMSMAKAIIKEECLKSFSHGTGKIAEKINKTLHSSVQKKPMFLTMYLVFFNIDTGELTFTNAGHHEYALIDKNGKAKLTGEAHNSFVGFFPNLKYEEDTIKLKPGEIFSLYTDGINDAQNSKKEFYEEVKLDTVFDELYNESISEYCDSIVDDVLKFQEGKKIDDITIFMLKRKN